MKRTGRMLDQTLGSRRLNNREDLTETIGSSSKITLIVSHDDSMRPVGRCKFCKQVHEPRRCEVFQELTKLARTKVNKKDIAPELQPYYSVNL
ncbi:hypothetical protein PHMEG_00011127 [Phytophthora megakarya]|uniref:Eukaryotic/viral aspartic protease n=1 Tax=Phytophthora megakarya TaxID=4795 RepID=A0A225WCC6_9STRA|nr:hypothetical protein PHMEG_00011127 [Phytophthora megakarya]